MKNIKYLKLIAKENLNTLILKKNNAKKVRNGINKEKSGDPSNSLKR